MSRRLVLRVQAEDDLDEAASWYESEKAGLGLKFIQDVNFLFERIEDNPFQFPVVHGKTRRAIARNYISDLAAAIPSAPPSLRRRSSHR